VKNLILVGVLSLALSAAACSKDEATKNDTAANKGDGATTEATLAANVVKISVPSMQCETCAKTIKKELSTVPGAENVDVNVDDKTVFVTVANNTPEMKSTIEQAISHAGYNTDTKKRDPAAYDALPDCCKESGGEH
jgi:copper chaperone CopZ